MTALTLKPWALRPIGNLNAYISAVLRLPMLTLEEERDCSEKFRANGDQEALDKLILSHLKLVVSIARDNLGYGFQHEDLIQEGNIGLLKAANRFDSDRGVRFATMAIPWITAQIYEFILNNWRMIKVATTKPRRKLFFKLRSIKEQLLLERGLNGLNFSLNTKEVDTVAKQLNVPKADVIEMDKYFGGFDMAIDLDNDDSVDNRAESTADAGSNPFSPLNYLFDPADAPDAKLAVAQRHALSLEVLKAIKKLDPRSRRIIEARWVKVKDNGIGKTLHDLAAEFKVSAERIRQLEVAALKQLKETLQDKQGYF